VTVTAGRPQQAVHAGGDDRQPPCGAIFYKDNISSADDGNVQFHAQDKRIHAFGGRTQWRSSQRSADSYLDRGRDPEWGRGWEAIMVQTREGKQKRGVLYNGR